MKRSIIISVLITLMFIPLFAQNYDEAPMKYSEALFKNKTPATRIKALQAFIKTYTDTSNTFVKLAYYQLALNYFDNKQYSQAITYAEKRIGMGAFGEGEEVRIQLVLGNSYAIKSGPKYNKGKALRHTNKAIQLAKAAQDVKLLRAAQGLKKKLDTPAAPKMTPEQKIKSYYSDDDYRQAVSYYNSLPAKDKANKEIHKVYAVSLLRLGRLDSALKIFNDMFAKEPSAWTALQIARVYEQKAAKNKTFLEQAVNGFLDAGWLYYKNKEFNKQKTAHKKANYLLQEKYDYQKKYRRINQMIKNQQSSSAKRQQDVRNAERELRKLRRQMRRDYPDMEPPQYMRDKEKKLQQKIQALKSGVSSQGNKEIEAFEKLQKDIEKEFRALKDESKKRLKI
jgi:tetratricopeptide (TPR) repeat protein